MLASDYICFKKLSDLITWLNTGADRADSHLFYMGPIASPTAIYPDNLIVRLPYMQHEKDVTKISKLLSN